MWKGHDKHGDHDQGEHYYTITIRRPSTDGTCSVKIICRPDLQGKITYRLDSSCMFCALLLFLDATQNHA